MIRKNRARSSSLFLTELLLSILFFSVTSAVCVQFFVKSRLMTRESQELTRAVNECSSIAEICKVSDGLDQTLALIQKEYAGSCETAQSSTSDHKDLILYYDRDFSPCAKGSAAYRLTASFSLEDFMLSADLAFLSVPDPDEENNEYTVIYELQTSNHIPRRICHEKR